MHALHTGQVFAQVAGDLAGEPGVAVPRPGDRRRFGSSALKVDGRIFAMVVSGRFVVKLPAERVAAMVNAGVGEPFESANGSAMREWVTVAGDDPVAWRGLAREALAFVRRSLDG